MACEPSYIVSLLHALDGHVQALAQIELARSENKEIFQVAPQQYRY